MFLNIFLPFSNIFQRLNQGLFNPTIKHIKTLILDEFDKSLEIGFEKEMKEIVASLPGIDKKILTSATQESDIPAFVGLYKPITINYLDQKIESNLELKTVLTPNKDTFSLDKTVVISFRIPTLS